MPRRLIKLSGYRTLFVILIILAALCHIQWVLFPKFTIYLLPVSFMICVYLGYKRSRWHGVLAAVLSTLPWTVAAVFSKEGVGLIGILFGDRRVSFGPLEGPFGINGYSLQFLVITAFLGYMSGLLFDVLGRILERHNSSLEALIPAKVPHAILLLIYRRVEGWWPSNRPIKKEGTNGSKQGLQAESRGRRIASISLKTSVIPLLVLLNFQVFVSNSGFNFIFPPLLLAAVLIIVIAYTRSSRAGIIVSLLVWFISLQIWVYLMFGNEIGDLFKKQLRLIPSNLLLARLIGLIILVWWAGKLGEIVRDEARRKKLQELFQEVLIRSRKKVRPSHLLFVILPPLAFGVSCYTKALTMNYHPYVILFVAIALYGHYRDAATVSNWVLGVLILLMLLPTYRSGPFYFYFKPSDTFVLVALALTPFAAEILDFSSLAACRLMAFGFLTTLILSQIYLNEARFVHTFMFTIETPLYYINYTLDIANWLLQLLLFEAAARFLRWTSLRWQVEGR